MMLSLGREAVEQFGAEAAAAEGSRALDVGDAVVDRDLRVG
jgi:hypothetical protein